jgi:hypothetical protein
MGDELLAEIKRAREQLMFQEHLEDEDDLQSA